MKPAKETSNTCVLRLAGWMMYCHIYNEVVRFGILKPQSSFILSIHYLYSLYFWETRVKTDATRLKEHFTDLLDQVKSPTCGREN